MLVIRSQAAPIGVAKSPHVHLELIGGDADGRILARSMLGERVSVGPLFVPKDELRAAISRSHVVAGIFGTSDKAARVVPYKVVHALAHGRPVVTASTPAIRRLLSPGVDCVTAPAGDADALADVLEALATDPGRLQAIGTAARQRFERSFAPRVVADRLDAAISSRLGLGRVARPRLLPGPSFQAVTS